MERWTRAVIANRKKVLAAWLVLFALGGYGASHLGELLTNRFKRPRLRRRTRPRPAQGTLQRARRRRLHAGLPEQATDRRRTAHAQRPAVVRHPLAGLPPPRRAGPSAQASSAVEGGKPGPVLYAVADTSPTPRSTRRCKTRTRPRRHRTIRAATPTAAGRRHLPHRASRRSTTTPRRSTTKTSTKGRRSRSRSR